MKQLGDLGREMYLCQECKIIDLDTYTGPGVIYWTLENGTTMTFPSGITIPLCSDFVPCEKHVKEIQEWNDK